MSKVTRNFLLSALRGGLTDTQIAEALDVTPSAVAQVIDANNLREIAAADNKYKVIDEHLNDVEALVVKRLKQKVTTEGLYMKSGELVRILQVTNAAKRRSIAAKDVVDDQKLITIQLPERLELAFSINSNNAIIAAGSTNLVTAPAATMEKITLERQNEKASLAEILQSGEAATAGQAQSAQSKTGPETPLVPADA